MHDRRPEALILERGIDDELLNIERLVINETANARDDLPIHFCYVKCLVFKFLFEVSNCLHERWQRGVVVDQRLAVERLSLEVQNMIQVFR